MDKTIDKERSTQDRIRSLERTIREISKETLQDKKTLRLLFMRNLLFGMARGIGTVIGIALLGTVGVYLLSRFEENDMAGVGEFIAEIVRWTQRKL